jgi:hypothetical protein
MKNNKRKVEIYFVLYLAALILLLPNKEENEEKAEENGSTIYNEYFTLLPEKTLLNCRFTSDSTGFDILSLDSVNTVYYTGNVSNVHFEFIIEDQSFKQTLVLNTSDKMESRHFSIIESEDRQAADFYWIPPIKDKISKSYVITVMATGIKRIVSDNAQVTLLPVKAKTQFSLNMIYIDKTAPDNQLLAEGAISDTNDPVTSEPNITPQLNIPLFLSGFNLNAEKTDIEKLAYQNWTNTIYANNIDLLTGIKQDIKLEVSLSSEDNGGTAIISDVFSDRIVLVGKTPFYGNMTVNLSVTREYDDQTYRLSFKVRPKLIEQAIYPREMYPDQTYTIDPKLPIMDSEIMALLKDGNLIRAKSIEGEKFTFSPDLKDIGKTLVLERYVGGELFGQSYNIYVKDFPNPEIWDIRRVSSDEVIVTTRSYGTVGGKRNEVVEFELKGNAKYEDKRGKINSQDPLILIQYFTFKPMNSDKPFNFEIRAEDKRGRKSDKSRFGM